MNLSDELLNVYGRQGRPAPNRLRYVPLVATNDNRPSAWIALAKMIAVFAFGGFALGVSLYCLWSFTR